MDGSSKPTDRPRRSRPVRVAEEIKQWVDAGLSAEGIHQRGGYF